MNTASFDVIEFKADDGTADQPQGLFAALVSVFGTVDRVGDRVMPGAFTKTLERWRDSGKPIPVVWSHQKDDPESYIGSVDPADMKETDAGLVVAGRLDIDTSSRARKVFDLLKTGRLRQWSFSYAVKSERMAKDKARDLLEVDLFEVGPTLIGAHQDALTLAVKDAGAPVNLEAAVTKQISEFGDELDAVLEAKVGRALSARTEKAIRQALATLEDVLTSIGQEDEVPTDEASTDAAAKDGSPDPDVTTTAVTVDPLLMELANAGTFLAERS